MMATDAEGRRIAFPNAQHVAMCLYKCRPLNLCAASHLDWMGWFNLCRLQPNALVEDLLPLFPESIHVPAFAVLPMFWSAMA